MDPYVRCCTIAGVCMKIYRTLFLPKETIGIMPENGYNREQRQSVIALKYLAYEANRTGYTIRTRNSAEGEFKIEKPGGGFFRVDGFVESENIVYEVLGCYYHGCRCCYPTEREMMSACGHTIEENYQLWLNRLMLLQSMHYVVRYVWECEINRMLKEDREMYRFFKNVEIVEPISIRRDGYFGGRTQPSRLYYKTTEGEEIKGFDIVSLYPSQMRDRPLPIGHPTVLRENEIDASSLPWKRPEDCIYKGVVKCRVVPPRNLLEPVLPYRAESGRLLFPLCSACGELAENPDDLGIIKCTHSNWERSWVHAFCHPEIEEALGRGYKVIKIYEVWQYENFSTTLFSGYVDTFMKMKVESSGFPDAVKTDGEKLEFVERYRREQGIIVDVQKVKKNAGLRHIAKLSLNSLYGKFGQSNNLSETLHVSSYLEMVSLFNDHRYIIQDLTIINKDVVRVRRCKKEEFIVESDISNIAICSFITCYSRLRLYNFLKLVEGRVLYVDTDSCYYISRPSMPDIPDSSLLGDMAQEYKEYFIDELVAAGAKQYGLHMIHRETGETKTVLKIRGFTLDSVAKQLLSYETLKRAVLKRFGPAKQMEDITLEFPQIKRSKRDGIQTVIQKKSYKAVYGKGLVLSNFETRPFGFQLD